MAGDGEEFGVDRSTDGDVPLPDRAHQLASRIDDAGHLHADEVEPVGDALLDDRRDPGVGPGEELVQVPERLGRRDLVDVDVTKSADCVGGFSSRRSPAADQSADVSGLVDELLVGLLPVEPLLDQLWRDVGCAASRLVRQDPLAVQSRGAG